MHARIHQYAATRFPPEELVRSSRQMLGAIGLIPGFVSFVLLDVGHGRLASVCICEAPAALDAVDSVASAWAAQHLESTNRSGDVATGQIVLQRGL